MPAHKANDPITSYRIVSGAIAAMPLVYVAVANIMKITGALPASGIGQLDPAMVTPISLALLAFGTTSSLTSMVLKKVLLEKLGVETQDAAARFKATLICMALSESGAVLGLVLMLLTGNMLYGGLLCGLSFAITYFHLPSRYWLEQGSPKD
ncbi:MAG: hypothetical protein JNK74_01630 [Candidatus Hydrogenedentes bacterium]|nr:hypothetical protein [Candidatus Hydrogenedentota bacterium]